MANRHFKGNDPKKYRDKTPASYKRVKVTGSKKPGYIRGTIVAQRRMFRRLRELHVEGFALLTQNLLNVARPSERRLLNAVAASFTAWEARVVDSLWPIIFRLYTTGLTAGAAEAEVGFRPDLPDENAVRAMAETTHGIVPALQHFVEEERVFAEKVIHSAFTGEMVPDLDEIVKKIQGRVSKEKWRIERIVRTETAKIAGFGRLQSWEADPRRDHYYYHWLATIDGRQKKVSEKFMREGPYTFEKIKELWTTPVAQVFVGGKWIMQDDRFNQRCTVSRTLKPAKVLVMEGLIDKDEARTAF